MLVDGDELVVLFSAGGNNELMLLRCSKDGACDASHPTTLVSHSGIDAVPVHDIVENSILVYASEAIPSSGNVLHLVRVPRDGGVQTILQEPASNDVTSTTFTASKDPPRIFMVQAAAPADGGAEVRVRALLPDGGPDPGFGTNGHAMTPRLSGLALVGVAPKDPGGVFVLAKDGSSFTAWLAFRADGTLDPAFGSDGGIGGSGEFSASALSADDAGYVVGGSLNSARAILARVNRDGAADSSYWDRGLFRFPPLESSDEPYVVEVRGLARESNGSVIVLGIAHQLLAPPVNVLARVGREGLDRSFGRNGIVILGPEDSLGPASLALQSDGKVIVATSADGTLRLARYLVQ
jgi:hypothetical protein